MKRSEEDLRLRKPPRRLCEIALKLHPRTENVARNPYGIRDIENYIKFFRLKPLVPDRRMDPSRVPAPAFLQP